MVCFHPDVGEVPFVDHVPDMQADVRLILEEQRLRHENVRRSAYALESHAMGLMRHLTARRPPLTCVRSPAAPPVVGRSCQRISVMLFA